MSPALCRDIVNFICLCVREMSGLATPTPGSGTPYVIRSREEGDRWGMILLLTSFLAWGRYTMFFEKGAVQTTRFMGSPWLNHET
jgi:hypothetical protein